MSNLCTVSDMTCDGSVIYYNIIKIINCINCVMLFRLEKETADRVGVVLLLLVCSSDAFSLKCSGRLDSVQDLSASQGLLAGTPSLFIYCIP